MASSRSMLAKLILDIEALGTVDKVSAEPFDVKKAPASSAYVAPGSGGRSEDDAGRSSNATGHSEQTFIVDFFRRSDTPNEDLLDTLDAFRNQVEPKTSGNIYDVNDLAAGARVETVNVDDWDPVRTSEDISNQLSALKVSVVVSYIYRRGNL